MYTVAKCAQAHSATQRAPPKIKCEELDSRAALQSLTLSLSLSLSMCVCVYTHGCTDSSSYSDAHWTHNKRGFGRTMLLDVALPSPLACREHTRNELALAVSSVCL
mmetsp:Transcript_9495/g.18529  ORF Transcript_9495/g.18529 Transcript_9495/m.18529 type:complete len:106 (+) Transcript_9495:67-384(+)